MSAAGCATTDFSRPGSELRDYETTPVEPAESVSRPSDPPRVPDGAFCFDREGVDTWLALSGLADDHAEMADKNADICRSVARERDFLLEAGREAERQSEILWQAHRRSQWEIWGYRITIGVLGIALIGNQ